MWNDLIQRWLDRRSWWNEARYTGLWPEAIVVVFIVVGIIGIGLGVAAIMLDARLQALEQRGSGIPTETPGPVATGR